MSDEYTIICTYTYFGNWNFLYKEYEHLKI